MSLSLSLKVPNVIESDVNPTEFTIRHNRGEEMEYKATF